MTKKIWDNFFENNRSTKKFGRYFFDYSKPDQDIVDLVPVLKRKKMIKILDIGCGEGRNSRFLSDEHFEVVGIDISKIAIQKAKKFDNSRTKYLVADMRELPFFDNSFDAVISIQTIFHGCLRDIRKTINEILRVTKKSGLIFLTLQPIKGNEYRMGKKLETNTYISNSGDDKGEIHHFFDQKEILKEFSKFKIIDLHLEQKNNYWYLLMKKTTKKSATADF